MSIEPEGRTPVYLQLAAALREAIERGDYLPGRPIPSENQLLQEQGLARATIRKAMRVLAAEGIVEVLPGRGVFVVERGAGIERSGDPS